jgi:formate/nitrite transporter FocA (FNT family)
MRREALFSGLLIGLGGAGFLALGGIPGAVIFAFGLISVVLSGVPLYTGKAGALPLKETWSLLKIWFWNVIGCILIGVLLKFTGGDYSTTATTIVQGRFQAGFLVAFLRAIGCGLIIDIAVSLYRQSGSLFYRQSGSLLPVIFGVPLFILCGFYHSIADVVYLTASWRWSPEILWYYPAIFLGNYVGCNVRRVVMPRNEIH